jgi:hypothetical protein
MFLAQVLEERLALLDQAVGRTFFFDEDVRNARGERHPLVARLDYLLMDAKRVEEVFPLRKTLAGKRLFGPRLLHDPQLGLRRPADKWSSRGEEVSRAVNLFLPVAQGPIRKSGVAKAPDPYFR